jgi:hypothetical protein
MGCRRSMPLKAERRMRSMQLILLALFPAQVLARQGVVLTRSGHTYQGYIRIQPHAVAVVNAAAGLHMHLPQSSLAAVLFQPDPVAPPLAGTSELEWGALPAPWRSDVVGGMHQPGQVKVFGGFFTVWGFGSQATADQEAFHFVHKPAGPRSDLVARLAILRWAEPPALAGLMMRAGLSSRAACVFAGVTAGRMAVVGWREAEGAELQQAGGGRVPNPCWLRLRRQDNFFAAFTSINGRQWKLLHTGQVDLADTIQAGLAVAGTQPERQSAVGFDQVREAPRLWTGPMLPRVHLVSGSSIVGLIDRVDDQAVYFLGSPPREPVATRLVAQIQFDWPRRFSPWRPGQTGVLLRTGQFVEGTFRGLEQGSVRISSVLLGPQQFDAEGEVAAILLRGATATPAPVAVRTLDGSTWLGRIEALGDGEVLVQEAALGMCRVPAYELAELRWPD